VRCYASGGRDGNTSTGLREQDREGLARRAERVRDGHEPIPGLKKRCPARIAALYDMQWRTPNLRDEMTLCLADDGRPGRAYLFIIPRTPRGPGKSAAFMMLNWAAQRPAA